MLWNFGRAGVKYFLGSLESANKLCEIGPFRWFGFCSLTTASNYRTEDTRMKGIVLIGAVIALLGLVAFAIPSFTTQETKDVVKLGDLKVQAKTEEPHTIPPMLSGGAMVLGILLIGAGVVMKRN
jgi:hypothetical protein